MVWGLIRVIIFTLTVVVLPLLIMSTLYLRLTCITKRQVRSGPSSTCFVEGDLLFVFSAASEMSCLRVLTEAEFILQLKQLTNKVGPRPARQSTDSKASRNNHDTAILRMAALLVGYFALAWIPTQVFIYISMLCKECHISDYIRLFLVL